METSGHSVQKWILSLLGFHKNDIETDDHVKVIKLTNEKYKLLDIASYEACQALLDELCDASS